MTEQQALARIIANLHEQGWQADRVNDGDEHVPVRGRPISNIAETCADTDEAWLYFMKEDIQGIVRLIWGNSPSELIADHTESNGFGAAVDAALRSVWPTWPDGED